MSQSGLYVFGWTDGRDGSPGVVKYRAAYAANKKYFDNHIDDDTDDDVDENDCY